MSAPRGHRLPILTAEGFRQVAVDIRGSDAIDRTVICVHGLSRNRRDFAWVADALAADGHRVITVDMPGRGDSDWLEDKANYGYPAYLQAAAAVIAWSGADSVDWIGTSMGGLIGLQLAAQPATPIRRLVLNDIGPHVPAEGRRRNMANFGTDPAFATKEEGIAFVKRTRTTFGPFTDAQWDAFAEATLSQRPGGGWGLHYDPGIAETAKQEPIRSTDLWHLWDRIPCPVLTVWGCESKLLLAGDVERMRTTGPRSEVHAVEGVGHCPGLASDAEIDAIRRFLS